MLKLASGSPEERHAQGPSSLHGEHLEYGACYRPFLLWGVLVDIGSFDLLRLRVLHAA